jgi:hypothetical protein
MGPNQRVRKRSRNGDDAIADIVRTMGVYGEAGQIAKVVGQWRRTQILIDFAKPFAVVSALALAGAHLVPGVRSLPGTLASRLFRDPTPVNQQPADAGSPPYLRPISSGRHALPMNPGLSDDRHPGRRPAGQPASLHSTHHRSPSIDRPAPVTGSTQSMT